MSSLYGRAVRSGGAHYCVVDAWRNGAAVATDLQVLGGSVTDDSGRRSLQIEIANELGLWDVLAPIGTELRPRSVVRYPSGVTEQVPMGVFVVDAQSMSYGDGGGSIQLSGSDKWVKIQRARFIQPIAANTGLLVREQIAMLIKGALGLSEQVNITATSTAGMGSVVWERDRDKAIEELARSIGATVFFDRDGVATVADLPTVGPTAVWTVDAGETGVMLSAQRDRDRKRTYNVVVAASDKADGEAPFPPIVVWDSDPNSPTYAGTDPIGNPGSAGPFGIVPYFLTSPLFQNGGQADAAARTALYRTIGRASQVSVTQFPNRALDALDVIDVLLPAERYDQEQPVERHIIDKIVHPLLNGPQSIDTRSTREDEFT